SVELREGGAAWVYVLMEYQSTFDANMPLRMLGYLVRIWERHRRKDRNAGRSLPPIVPIVLTHAPRGWTTPVHFWDQVAPHPNSLAAFADAVPAFTVRVEDLSRWPDARLRSMSLAAFPKLALWMLRDARDGDRLMAKLGRWLTAFTEALAAPHGSRS